MGWKTLEWKEINFEEEYNSTLYKPKNDLL